MTSPKGMAAQPIDLLTVLQELGDDLNVEERFVIVGADGRRYGTFPTKVLAEASRWSSQFIEREVRLRSDWRVVADG